MFLSLSPARCIPQTHSGQFAITTPPTVLPLNQFDSTLEVKRESYPAWVNVKNQNAFYNKEPTLEN